MPSGPKLALPLDVVTTCQFFQRQQMTLGPDSLKIGDCKTVLELKYFFKINLNPLCIARDLSINNFLSPESAKSTEKSRVLQPLLAQHLRKMLILRLKIGSFFYV